MCLQARSERQRETPMYSKQHWQRANLSAIDCDCSTHCRVEITAAEIRQINQITLKPLRPIWDIIWLPNSRKNMCDLSNPRQLHTLTALAAAHVKLWLRRVFMLDRKCHNEVKVQAVGSEWRTGRFLSITDQHFRCFWFFKHAPPAHTGKYANSHKMSAESSSKGGRFRAPLKRCLSERPDFVPSFNTI